MAAGSNVKLQGQLLLHTTTMTLPPATAFVGRRLTSERGTCTLAVSHAVSVSRSVSASDTISDKAHSKDSEPDSVLGYGYTSLLKTYLCGLSKASTATHTQHTDKYKYWQDEPTPSLKSPKIVLQLNAKGLPPILGHLTIMSQIGLSKSCFPPYRSVIVLVLLAGFWLSEILLALPAASSLNSVFFVPGGRSFWTTCRNLSFHWAFELSGDQYHSPRADWFGEGCDEEEFTPGAAAACLANHSLLFMGDSVTRYQYGNLVSALRRGSWEVEDPPNEYSHGWGTWKDFFIGIAARMGSEEICDCGRGSGDLFSTFFERPHGAWGEGPNQSMPLIEARYFTRPAAGLSVMHMSQLSAEKGTAWHDPAWMGVFCDSPPCLQQGCSVGECMPRHSDARDEPWTITAGYSTLLEFAARMRPKVIVYNIGIWDYPSLEYIDGLIAAFRIAMRDYGLRLAVWKTTTTCSPHRVIWHDMAPEPLFIAQAFRSAGPGFAVFDAGALTSDLRDFGRSPALEQLFFHDNLHYKHVVYTALNKALVATICGAEGLLSLL